MKVYVGQTRSRWLIAELATLGWGECTNRGELPPRRVPWFFDNGAFVDWRAGVPWDEEAYCQDLTELRAHPLCRPDFLVAPDIVAGGAASLARSREWLEDLRELGPVYLAVQNGMPLEAATVAGFDGIFIGGDNDFKREAAAACVLLGRELGLPVHLGRAGTGRKVRWARDLGVSSIDSTSPLWDKDNLRVFREALVDPQLPMFGVEEM